ncbi:DUF6194 family protein [Nocardia sp. NBC_01009]|uniref:DUF6194 family protein n=1 Tax=Nocardia sp. NBC_01009 TaxID=2975996 RepID=UPI00386F3200|nr:DUF6194 family protein [Nocardia sp. NBC_01009]
MDADEVKRYIGEKFEGVVVSGYLGDSFFIYDPNRDLPAKRQIPFATIVTGDNYDTVSALDHEDAYRLNISLTKDTFTAMFGQVPTRRDENGTLATDYDYAARDQLMPHPTYGAQHWVCVVNPSDETFDAIEPLLAEAYRFTARKHANWLARRRSVAQRQAD